MNYLPVGSQEATEFYADCALEAGVAFVNNIPVFIASATPSGRSSSRTPALPIIGDDIKAQLGATIVHRVLTDLFAKRGVKLDRTYQLNTGGNTDFLNMSNRRRLASQEDQQDRGGPVGRRAERLEDENIHVGPSRLCARGRTTTRSASCAWRAQLFGGVPMNLELRLSVEDSPNCAGVAIDMIRCAKIARDRGLKGAVDPRIAPISASTRAPR